MVTFSDISTKKLVLFPDLKWLKASLYINAFIFNRQTLITSSSKQEDWLRGFKPELFNRHLRNTNKPIS